MEKETISVPISFEYLLTVLFGKQTYHGFVGVHKVYNWKTHILKLFNAIRKSIIINITVTDEFHKNELLVISARAVEKIRQCKTKDEVNILAIEYLTRIIFELMGKMPNNWDKRIVNRLEYWKLDEFRKLGYTQTERQKLNLILSLPNRDQYSDRFSDKSELFYKYRVNFRSNNNKFIKWFKEKYKDIYVELF